MTSDTANIPQKENVAILGASNNQDRYAWRALKLLQETGHNPIPVSARAAEVGGLPAYAKLVDIPEPVDTVTIYLSPENLAGCVEDIIAKHPGRAIFNPGSESPSAMKTLREQGIEVETACTLVLLRTGQF